MTNYQKFGLVAGQVFMGLGFAMLGIVTEVIVVHIISMTRDIYMDTFGTIMSSWIGCLIGFLTGMGLDGYRFLKKQGRQNEFLRFLLLVAFGTSGGFFGLYFVVVNSSILRLPSPLIYFLILALPLTGTILPSILVLSKDRTKKLV